MHGLIQRVREAWVTSAPRRGGEAHEVGRIGHGIVLLVGVTHDDDERAARRLAERAWTLRIFPDADGAMNLGCAEVDGGVLVVSQFTLCADTRKGRRPSYVDAAPPEQAEPLVEAVVGRLRELGAVVATGRFRTHMEVGLVNDGPVTVTLRT